MNQIGEWLKQFGPKARFKRGQSAKLQTISKNGTQLK
jgi:hypothetical protein